MTKENILEALRDAKTVARDGYAWPGGYPLFLVMSDGGCLCPTCVNSEWRNVAHSTIGGYRDGWQAAGADINWEDPELICDHCDRAIESAYGEA